MKLADPVYIEASLDHIIKEWAKDYTHEDLGKFYSHEAFIDTHKRTVVFKITFEEKDDKQ